MESDLKAKKHQGILFIMDENASSEIGNNQNAQGPAPEGVASDMGNWMEKLNEAQKELERQRNDYLMAVADLENYRKRVTKEKEEARIAAKTDVLEGLLPIVDNLALGLEAANRHKADSVGTVLRGFEMILAQMQALLKDYGVELIEPKRGDKFDPNNHEGVAHAPDDAIPEGHIVEVVRPGYRVAGRLLRPVSVVVSSGKNTEAGGVDS